MKSLLFRSIQSLIFRSIQSLISRSIQSLLSRSKESLIYIQKYTISDIQKYTISDIQKYTISYIQKYEISYIHKHTISDIQKYRISDIPPYDERVARGKLLPRRKSPPGIRQFLMIKAHMLGCCCGLVIKTHVHGVRIYKRKRKMSSELFGPLYLIIVQGPLQVSLFCVYSLHPRQWVTQSSLVQNTVHSTIRTKQCRRHLPFPLDVLTLLHMIVRIKIYLISLFVTKHLSPKCLKLHFNNVA